MSAEDQNIGRLVAGRYRLDELLGRGGYGSVYQSWDTQIARDVAVKLLDVQGDRSPDGRAELRERFRREAMAAGRINHRCVVTIYDFGVPDDGSEAYIVMELLRGHDLAEELDTRGPLMPDRALKMFVPMLEALGRGHDLGIVHKDIKPQNIFIRDPGTMNESMCLVDFGVARVIHEDKLTMTGLIVGTPQYLAPEYITETVVTPRLDVYQMGLIIAEAITGVPAVPLGETFVRSCNRHFTGELDIPDSLMEGSLGDVLGAALQPNPDERIADATEMCRRLASVDPSTISVEFQETMVFQRTPERRATAGDVPMFPPMNPEQVSQELERQRRDPSAAFENHHTPASVAGPASDAMQAVSAGSLGSEASDTMWPAAQQVPVSYGSSPSIQVSQGSNPAIRVPSSHGSNPAIRVPSSHGSNPAIRVDPSPGSNPAIRVPPQQGSNPSIRVPQQVEAQSAPSQESWEWGGAPPVGQAQSLSEATSAEATNSGVGTGLIVTMIVVLLGVFGAGIFLLLHFFGQPQAEVAQAEPAPVVAPAETAEPDDDLQVEPIVEATTTMKVESVPAGATLVIEGLEDQKTPATIELDQLAAKRAKLTLDGYEPAEFEIAEGTRTVELERRRERTASKRADEPRRKRQTDSTTAQEAAQEEALDDVKRLNLSEVAAQGAANAEAELQPTEESEQPADPIEEEGDPVEEPPVEEKTETKPPPAKWNAKPENSVDVF